MKELEKIYELWSNEQSDNSDIIHKWCDLNSYLCDTCSDSVRENIENYILEYGKLLEEQSFISGFKLAFRLWTEVGCFDKV